MLTFGTRCIACYCAGYGNIVPISPGGRAFTVVYALLGIPLHLVMLAAIGWWLSRAFDYCFFKPCHFGDDEDRSKWSIGKHIVRMLISLAIFLGFFAFIPAFVFRVLEKWTIGEGIYYALITLTTIGLGDYEAGQFYCCWCFYKRQFRVEYDGIQLFIHSFILNQAKRLYLHTSKTNENINDKTNTKKFKKGRNRRKKHHTTIQRLSFIATSTSELIILMWMWLMSVLESAACYRIAYRWNKMSYLKRIYSDFYCCTNYKRLLDHSSCPFVYLSVTYVHCAHNSPANVLNSKLCAPKFPTLALSTMLTRGRPILRFFSGRLRGDVSQTMMPKV